MAMVLETFISNFLDVLAQLVRKGNITLQLERTLLELKTVATGIDLRSTDDTGKVVISDIKDALYIVADMDYFQLKQHGASMGTGCFHLILQGRSRFRILQLDLKLKHITLRFTRSLNQYENRRTVRHVNRLKPSSIVTSSDTVGEQVEQDTVGLLEILFQRYNNNENTIIAIIGAAGIGKSTITRKIFDLVAEEFEVRIWLSVTGSFNDADLLKTILRSLGDEMGSHGSEDMFTMVSRLHDVVKNRRIFLVLDDMWSSGLWDTLLRTAFRGDRQRNVILVTTRNGDVAAAIDPTHVHRVDKLNPEVAWSLLMKNVASGDSQIDKLREIGMKIVERCDYLPLAIKMVAEQLRKKNRTKSAWLDVLNNQKWSEKGLPEELNESIYLSFDHLSPDLKQCFLYCCLFYDEEINYDKVVQMLMAEGFIPSDGGSNQPEALGLKYYRELVTKNLLEPSDRNYDQSHCAIMPSVLRSFAQYIARDEVLLVEDGKITSAPLSKFRRVSVSNKGAEFSDLQTHKSIRALLSFGNMLIKPGDSLSTLPLLRILHVNKTKVCTLVDSLRHLKLLRYLDLSKTDVSALPHYIGEMKSLQYICLQGCEKMSQLPKSIVNLEMLRFLDISGTQVMTVPRDFGKLVNLVLLKGFPAYTDNEKNWCTMEELGPLHQLMHLTIRGTENISTKSLATGPMLAEKRHLKSLWLCCTSSDAYEQHSQEAFDVLCPSPSLEDLTITGYFGRQVPRWLLTLDLENLRLLKLQNLHSCTQLPCSFGQLPNLESLCIRHALSIRRVGEEFLAPSSTLLSDSDGEEMDIRTTRHYASVAASTIAFPKLTKLVFYGMMQWTEWDWDEKLEAMRVLESLQISRCRLSHLPPGLAGQTMALRVVTIEKSMNLVSVENFTSVVELYLHSNYNLEKIANLPNLKNLRLSKCPKLKVLEAVKALSSIELKDHEMRTLPRYLRVLQLGWLQIDCNLSFLQLLSLKDPALEWDNVSHIGRVEAYAEGYEQSKRCSVVYKKRTGSFVTDMGDSANSAVNERPES